MSEPENEKPLGLTSAQILDILEKGDIIEEHGILRWSSNYAFLVSICYESLTVTAVYKPQKGERPLWDFPDGTLCYRERAAFLTSECLGWEIVPPTVLRDGRRGLGSFQFFIDHDPQINYFSFDDSVTPQLQRIAAFDYLVNNADRKGGHCLLDEKGHVWGIDHGLTFHTAHKLRTVIWNFDGDTVPDALLCDVERLCAAMEAPDGAHRKALGKLLSQAEINALHARTRHMLRSRRYPTPGPGPNYPWPPV